MAVILYTHCTAIVVISINVYAGFTHAQSCRDTGSVDFSEGSIVTQNSTYIIPSYRIPCDGTVVGWEFCHQNVDAQTATFYPSVWRLDSSSYKLIHVSSVSFVPRVMGGLTFACTGYNVLMNEQFSVLTNDTVGLYSDDNTSQILTTSNGAGISYSMAGNHSNISIDDGAMMEQFRVAIVAQISEHIVIIDTQMQAAIFIMHALCSYIYVCLYCR